MNGCVFDAKWDATYFVKEALEYGADLICDFNAFEILHENNEVVGFIFSHIRKIEKEHCCEAAEKVYKDYCKLTQWSFFSV